jgi:soluble lytic murein transglycosylase-like protein
MTLHHILRTIIVAGFATAALIAAREARAEGGDGSSVYAAISAAEAAQEPAVAAHAPAAEPSAAEEDKASALAKRGARLASTPAATAAVKSLILQYADENGVPFTLADAVVRIESRYDAKARNGVNVGLTQINVQTAQSLGYSGPATGLFDPETNLRYGLRYLAQAYKLAGGDTCGTILRYQAGHRALSMTGAARAYCAKVKTILASAEAS